MADSKMPPAPGVNGAREGATKPSSPSGDEGVPANEDSLSLLQRKLDDIGQMFYTYIGILQRDAPPVARGPDEADEASADKKARAELEAKVPEYAMDIVQTSKDIDAAIDAIEVELREVAISGERAALERADTDSRAAGNQLETAATEAKNLLADVRGVIAMRDQDELVQKNTANSTAPTAGATS